MFVTDDIRYIGVDDHRTDLFEGQYPVPNGISYNSYVIMDSKIAVMDTVDGKFTHEWLDNLQHVIGEKKPDYLVVHHMEPDHSASIASFMSAYPDTVVVASPKAFPMMQGFFGKDFSKRSIAVAEGETLSLGRHSLSFICAPMVHWPEVIMTYDSADRVLFSADAFGKFGANDVPEAWDDEARRNYIGIVGKYGVQVQNVLNKAAGLDVRMICPLHGPVLSGNLRHYLDLYGTWSSYAVESPGIVIAYTSVYGNTKRAVEILEEKLRTKGCPEVVVHDLARVDMSKAVADAFRYGRLVLASTTYNAGVFPFMRQFLEHLAERNFQNRTVGLIENGSWAPQAAKVMSGMLSCLKGISYAQSVVHIKSALDKESAAQLEALADELCKDYMAQDSRTADKNDMKALFKIGYGLYVITSNDGRKDNGMIVNTVSQVTSAPNRIAVCIDKKNYTYHVVRQSGIMNLNCLSVDAPFKVFETFGFQSGRNVNKFADCTDKPLRTDNGLLFLPKFINAVMSLKVEQHVDLDTHGMFICDVTEARVLSERETMTYAYYHENVKPRPRTEGKKGWVCRICGYVYEGETLPEDFICPLCKHGAADFEPIK